MCFNRYKVPMQTRALGAFAGLLALLCLALPWAGARAAFDGYDGDTPDIVWDDGASVGSSAGDASIAGATDPVWSPDATRLAYVSGGRITVSAPDGSGATAIAAGTEPAWSPDGTKLAYVAADGNVHVIGADGSGDTNLTNTASPTNFDPAWSPTGAQIAFARKLNAGAGNYAIFVMSASNGSGQTQLTTGVSNDRHPAWSPDGSTIAFDSDRDGNEQIYTMPANGGNPTRVTSSTSNDEMPTYSPQGDLIAFARVGSGIVTIPAGGGTETPVASPATAENPDWKIFPPKNTAAPSVSGPLQVGSTLTASPGSWIGARSFAYQWSRCTSSSGGCSTIAGATSSSYTIQDADKGGYLKVSVVASNSAGDSAPADSPEVGFVGGAGPLILTLPTITLGFGSLDNEPTIGFYVFGSNGTWQSNLPLTYTYQWLQCQRNGGPCAPIPGATTSTFLITADLVGRELVFAVTAHNSAGDTYIQSNRTTAVTGLPPHSRGTPPILGTNEVGQTLTVTSGPWTGSGTFTYTFDWRRCDAFGNLSSCVSIPGATTSGGLSSSYVLQPADIGYTIRVYITARNTVGSATVITNHTYPTLPKRKFVPQPSAPPAITGDAHPGKKLVATVGTWTGDSPISYALYWRRCNATVTACVTLKVKRHSYTLTNRDLGHTFVVVVNATNAAGTTQATSAPTDPVSLTPKRRRGRRIVGTNGPDYLAGTKYDDVIYGRGGNDTIYGGAGNDTIYGGPGDDVIYGGPGQDRIYGGPGSDTIYAADGEKDVIDCGPGSDRVFADPIDVLKNCESVTYENVAASSTSP